MTVLATCGEVEWHNFRDPLCLRILSVILMSEAEPVSPIRLVHSYQPGVLNAIFGLLNTCMLRHAGSAIFQMSHDTLRHSA
jgi:hypothetical protein